MGISKENKSTTINIRATETTKRNLDLLTQKLSEQTGFPVSQADVIAKLIRQELDRQFGFYSQDEK